MKLIYVLLIISIYHPFSKHTDVQAQIACDRVSAVMFNPEKQQQKKGEWLEMGLLILEKWGGINGNAELSYALERKDT